ncbi:MAG: SMC-Scp complex subunit ScpB [Thermoanaerobaculia bacterium]
MTDDQDEMIPELSASEAGPEPSPVAEPTAAEPVPAVEPGGASAPADSDSNLDEVLPLVEALLFASSKPIPLDKLAEAAELSEEVVARALDVLEAGCAAAGRGVRLDRVAGGVRLVSRPEYDYPVRRLLGLDGKTKLSMAALETLAIVAYRQPVTGPEIAELRAVNSSSSIRTLLDRKLITTAGRKEVVGTPFLYKTTKEFLVHFGLKGLGDLPKPEELEAIYGLEAPKPDPAQVELFHVDEATGEVEEIEEGGPADSDPSGEEQNGPDEELPAPGRASGDAESAEEAGPVPGDETPRGEDRNDG